MKQYTLEIACFSAESAFVAAANGAGRIELCEDYSCGGISPSAETAMQVIKQVKVPVFIMIRPRAGNFIYRASELEYMKQQMILFGEMGCAGFVFGALTSENTVDLDACKYLVSSTGSLPCTFHRAFDITPDPGKALENVIACGFSRILTSGGQDTAMAGAAQIRELITRANNRIVIMPGGGVRASNISDLRNVTGAVEYHSAALDKQRDKIDPEEIIALKRNLVL
ncbi:MAG: copper homeostasis protein CutC [Bacteroidetes bacterium]|nr:copper homeostasis protein CutC [Bacteroidota bacterium]